MAKQIIVPPFLNINSVNLCVFFSLNPNYTSEVLFIALLHVSVDVWIFSLRFVAEINKQYFNTRLINEVINFTPRY